MFTVKIYKEILCYVIVTIKRRTLLKVYQREIFIRLKAFRIFFLMFFSLIFIGAGVLSDRMNLPFVYAMYEIFAMFFFATDLNYPFNDPLLQLLWFIFPFFGLMILVDGLSSLGTALKFSDQLSSEWNIEMANLMNNHIIIVGIGNVGFKLLKQLKDYDVVAIDKFDEKGRDEEVFEYKTINHLPFIRGDATRTKILEDAGIDKASAIIILIDNDLLNIKIALLAKKLNPEIKTIVRMFDIEFGRDIKDKMEIDAVISTSSISIPYFIDAINENIKLEKSSE